MKIESTDQEIRNLLSSGYFRIPRFQRPYSWTQENIQEFWDDVVRDNPTDYFIGAMVVFRDGNQRYGVVDGQQRLTTITILLAALRNTLSEEGFVDLAEGIQGLIERKNIDNKPILFGTICAVFCWAGFCTVLDGGDGVALGTKRFLRRQVVNHP